MSSPTDTEYDLYVCVFGAVAKGCRHVPCVQIDESDRDGAGRERQS
jgi:hypothetical protein